MIEQNIPILKSPWNGESLPIWKLTVLPSGITGLNIMHVRERTAHLK